jgi:hypothetical protein
VKAVKPKKTAVRTVAATQAYTVTNKPILVSLNAEMVCAPLQSLKKAAVKTVDVKLAFTVTNN